MRSRRCAAGVEIAERQAAGPRQRAQRHVRVLGAEARLLAPRRRDFDVLIVGYPGHFDVPRARRVAGPRAARLRRRPVARGRARDGAPPVPRPLHGGDRPASRRLSGLAAPRSRRLRYRGRGRIPARDGARRTEAVFLGADEELFSETWSPTYPFSALHFADASTEVVEAAAAARLRASAPAPGATRSRQTSSGSRSPTPASSSAASASRARSRPSSSRHSPRAHPSSPRTPRPPASSSPTASRRSSSSRRSRRARRGARPARWRRYAAHANRCARPRGVRRAGVSPRARRALVLLESVPRSGSAAAAGRRRARA